MADPGHKELEGDTRKEISQVEGEEKIIVVPGLLKTALHKRLNSRL